MLAIVLKKCKKRKNLLQLSYYKMKYRIKIVELMDVKFDNPNINSMIEMRYAKFLDGLDIRLSPEVLTLLLLLHEIGHIEFWETYLCVVETDNPIFAIDAYSNNLSSLYALVMKPWEFAGMDDLNINHTMFNVIETYPELFSLKHFPRFIRLLTKYNLCKGE